MTIDITKVELSFAIELNLTQILDCVKAFYQCLYVNLSYHAYLITVKNFGIGSSFAMLKYMRNLEGCDSFILRQGILLGICD